jgi:hypothetical protein
MIVVAEPSAMTTAPSASNPGASVTQNSPH